MKKELTQGLRHNPRVFKIVCTNINLTQILEKKV